MISCTQGTGFPFVRAPNYCGTIISGEAPESDDGKVLHLIILLIYNKNNKLVIFFSDLIYSLDGTSISSVSGAVDAMTCIPEMKIPKSKKCSIKYNSLLHKKLRKFKLVSKIIE